MVWAHTGILFAADDLDGICISDYLSTLNKLRVTQNVATAEQTIKDFWVWYGLTLLPKVSHKNWKWKDASIRETVRMYDCVSISDEALAMQVLDLRGSRYMEMRSQKKNGTPPVFGRKSGNTDKGGTGAVNTSLMSMTENVARFVEFYGVVKAIKEEQKNDALGWCSYLTMKQVEKSGGSTSGGKRKKRDTILNMMDLPVDEVAV